MTSDRLKDLMNLIERAETIQKEMEQLKGKVELLKDYLELMRDDEQDGLDDLPLYDMYEELQETMEENVDELDDAVSKLDDLIENMDLDEVLEHLNEVKENTLRCDLLEEDVDEDEAEKEEYGWMDDDEEEEDDDDDDYREKTRKKDGSNGGNHFLDRSVSDIMNDYNEGYRRGRWDAIFGDRYNYIHGVQGSDSYQQGYTTGFEQNDNHCDD